MIILFLIFIITFIVSYAMAKEKMSVDNEIYIDTDKMEYLESQIQAQEKIVEMSKEMLDYEKYTLDNMNYWWKDTKNPKYYKQYEKYMKAQAKYIKESAKLDKYVNEIDNILY